MCMKKLTQQPPHTWEPDRVWKYSTGGQHSDKVPVIPSKVEVWNYMEYKNRHLNLDTLMGWHLCFGNSHCLSYRSSLS